MLSEPGAPDRKSFFETKESAKYTAKVVPGVTEATQPQNEGGVRDNSRVSMFKLKEKDIRSMEDLCRSTTVCAGEVHRAVREGGHLLGSLP